MRGFCAWKMITTILVHIQCFDLICTLSVITLFAQNFPALSLSTQFTVGTAFFPTSLILALAL